MRFPVVALAPLPIWIWLNRKEKPGARQLLAAWLISIAGVAAHHLMDWLNVYGIRLLLPFSADWLRLDLVYIVDLWVWLILLMAMAAPALPLLARSGLAAHAHARIPAGPEGPTAEQRRAARFAVVVTAERQFERRRVTAIGRDPYRVTAEILAGAADDLRRRDAVRAGVLAPAEAFDADRALAELGRSTDLEVQR